MSKKKQNKSSQKQQQVQSASLMGFAEKNKWVWLFAILLITYIAYLPSLKNGFTNWDDNVYVPENVFIKSLKADNVKQIFNPDNHVSLNYHPVTILSLAIDYKLSGYNAKTYHTTNLIFHLLNTALVFVFIYFLTDKKTTVAAIVSILFGIHPMHVESVAWISERKDVLYVFFFLLALIAYLKYIEQQAKQKLLLLLVAIFFMLSVFSKAMGIVLPVILLLIDYYRNRKIDKMSLLEKLPFFALSVYFGLLAVNIQSNGAIASFSVFTVWQRICFASYGIISYIFKLFLPVNLTCFYPYPNLVNNHMPVIFYIAPAVVLLLIGLTVYLVNKNKTLVFGFLFFLVSVAMVLQFVSVGKAIMAERYTYLSYIGLFFPIAMGYQWLLDSNENSVFPLKTATKLILAAMLVFFFYTTFDRTKVWEDSDVLWTDAITKNPNNETAYTNRGSYLINKKSYDIDKKVVEEIETERALSDFNISIKMNPTSAKVFTNRANIYGLKNQFELSLQDYTSAIALDSTDAEVYANRGVTYSIMQQYDNAIADYTKAMSMRNNFTVAKQNRAYAYVNSGKYDKAIAELNELINENNTILDYYIYRGVAFFNTGNYKAALDDNTSAININTQYNRAYYNRAATYEALKNFKAALQDALKAKDLGYTVSENYLNRLNTLSK
jgi:tetratricopeptide (TPR) repeat protein